MINSIKMQELCRARLADPGLTENFSAFEVDEELLPNLREYSLANAIYWGLAEGHACEQSARRNAMDVSRHEPLTLTFDPCSKS